MRYLSFAPLGRDLSRLILGTAGYEQAPLDVALDVFDAYRELGGNVVDTGREYGNAETILGRWLRERRVGDEIVVLTKGAHHDNDTGRRRVNPREITEDLDESLRTLGRPAVDIYCLHRDDPAAPVGPILETLTRHRRTGRVRVLGASNWSTARLEAAAQHAARHGLDGFACSSPGLSRRRPGSTPSRSTRARRAPGTRATSSPCSPGRRWPAGSSRGFRTPISRGSTTPPTTGSVFAARRRWPRGEGRPRARSRSPGSSTNHSPPMP